jgi:hypothetical protein
MFPWVHAAAMLLPGVRDGTGKSLVVRNECQSSQICLGIQGAVFYSSNERVELSRSWSGRDKVSTRILNSRSDLTFVLDCRKPPAKMRRASPQHRNKSFATIIHACDESQVLSTLCYNHIVDLQPVYLVRKRCSHVGEELARSPWSFLEASQKLEACANITASIVSANPTVHLLILMKSISRYTHTRKVLLQYLRPQTTPNNRFSSIFPTSASLRQMSSSDQSNPSNAADVTNNQNSTPEATASTTPLPLPEPTQDGQTTKIDMSTGGQTVKLDHMGPLVVNKDGTLSRISNWGEMSEIERANTVRILGKRNMLRREALAGQEGKKKE